MAKSKTHIDKSVARRTLHYYWLELKKYKWHTLFWAIVSPLVVLVTNILVPLIMANIIGAVAEGASEERIMNELLPQAIGLVVLNLIFKVALHQVRIIVSWRQEMFAMRDLSLLCFNTLNDQSMQFHSDRFSGSLVSQVNKFTRGFEALIDMLLWTVIPLVFTTVFAIGVLFTVVPIVALLVTILVVAYVAVAVVAYGKIAHFNEEEATALNHVTGQLSDSVSNIMSVKSYAREKHENKRFTTYVNEWLGINFEMFKSYARRNIIFDLIGTLNIALILFFLLTGYGWFGLSISTLVLISSYCQQIVGQLFSVNGVLRQTNRIFGDAHDMTVTLDAADEVVDSPSAKPLRVKDAGVEFSHITFQHQDAKQPIFQDFSLQIRPGERVGLVGVSGSGKTTLTKLLLRFADVSAGEIAIDGQDIKEITQHSLRENIAYVPQETALFHRSIAENIAYARPAASQKEVERAARLANAHEFIKDLPNGYDTLVGERGIKLSGGQRQRIAIARAILKDAPILVLDEATSALDSESEALIQDALIKLMNGRTSIVVAHRLSTIADMDRIIVLQDGEIVEQGRHTDLVKGSGAYSKLWSRQSGAFLDGE